MDKRDRFWLIAASLIIGGFPLKQSVMAQSHKSQNSPAKKQSKRQKPEDSVIQQASLSPDQQNALLVLESLYYKAEDIDDKQFKIILQAKIADAMWKHDEPQARRFFTEVFGYTEALKEQQAKEESASSKQPLHKTIKYQLQQQVLQLASRRDFDFAKRLADSADALSKASDISEQSGSKGGRSYGKSLQYLQLAACIADSDPAKAAEVVRDNLRHEVSPLFIQVLMGIRHKDPALANMLFIESMLTAQSRPDSLFRNILQLLPFVYPSEEEMFYGRDSTMSDPERKAVLDKFLSFAQQAILKQMRAWQAGGTVKAARTVYVALQEILFLTDKYSPDKSSALRAGLNSLHQVFTAEQKRILNGTTESKEIEKILEQAITINESPQKDRLFLQAASEAANKGNYEKALSIIKEIKNENDRKYLISVLYYQSGLRAIDTGSLDAAYRQAIEIEFLPERAELFRQIAGSYLKKGEMQRSLDILEEVVAWIRQSAESPQKARELLNMVGAFASHDVMRSFDILQMAVEAINKTDFDTSRQKELCKSDGIIKMAAVAIESLDFSGSFSILARSDFDRSLLLAQLLDNRKATMLAQVAACHGILDTGKL